MKIARVFPKRTSHTPDDELAFIGPPPAEMPVVDEVHVSCVFTWQRAACEDLRDQWAAKVPVLVRLGGPGTGDAAGEFEPGLYVKQGITYTTRGCPNKCPWCLVPKLEGKLRCLEIKPGHTIQDNNIVAAPKAHFFEVFHMLGEQRRGATFAGGIEARRLKDWHLDAFKAMRIKCIWTALDALKPDERTIRGIRSLSSFLPRRKLQCYVIIGHDGETLGDAERRLRGVWELGALPFAQLYRPIGEDAKRDWPRPWKDLARTFSRPAAMFAMEKEGKL